MTRKRALLAGIVLIVAAVAVWARQAGPASGAGVHTLTLGTLPWSVAIDAGTGHVFVVNRMTDNNGMPTGDGSVSILDTSARAVLRTVPVGPDPRDVVVDSSPVPGSPGGRIYVVNDDDATLRVLDAHSGNILRNVPVGSRPHAVAVDPQTGRAFVLNTADGTVSVLDTRRWTVVRTVSVGADFMHAAIAVDARTSRAFVGAANTITVLDASSGAALGATTLDGAVDGLAVDATAQRSAPNGQVFVAGEHGLSVLDARTGHLMRTLLAGAPISAVAVDTRRHRLVIAPGVLDARTPVGNGTVRILDERSGAVLRSVPVGVAPMAVAVDERTGHAVVVNAGGFVPVSDPWKWVPSWLRARIPWLAPGPSTRTVPGSVSVFDATTHAP